MSRMPSSIGRILGCSLFVGVIIVPTGLEANNRRNRAQPALKGAASELPTVKRVGNGMITVGEKTYEVPDSARITVDGEEADLSDIEPGMQAKVTGGVAKFGKNKADTIYKATRISAREDNKLEAKRKEWNKKQRERARRMNQQRNNRNRNRR